MTNNERIINVGYLARVEGEGSLYVRVVDGQVNDVKLRIFEPPRFFEGFLQGRAYHEVPDITARICGICPVAYQMSSVHALEQAFDGQVGGQLRALRRLLYCAEWIESHALHIYLLHAPDFLGYPDAIRMAEKYPTAVQRGLRLKKIGNELMALIGGREIHPINVRVGGFYHLPSVAQLQALVPELTWARDAAIETALWVAEFAFPTFHVDYEFVALHHPDEYPYNEGRLISNRGLDIEIADYLEHFEERHEAHSTALHAYLKARGNYMVGPLARFNLNYEQLSPLVQDVAKQLHFEPPCTNPFQSIIVRSLETVYACDEALRIIADYVPPLSAAVPIQPHAGVGHGCTEAPRGILYHRYAVDEDGLIREARIIPPTSQNQRTIELDLQQFVQANLALPHATLQWQCEQAIRNYDPCISCSTHFIQLEIDHDA